MVCYFGFLFSTIFIYLKFYFILFLQFLDCWDNSIVFLLLFFLMRDTIIDSFMFFILIWVKVLVILLFVLVIFISIFKKGNFFILF